MIKQHQKISQIVPVHSWCFPPKSFMLKTDEVHVWRVSLNLMKSWAINMQHILSIDERKRAERFYSQKDRENYIIVHIMLRTILSRYLNIEPVQVRFCYNSCGKPALVISSCQNIPRFNLTHSGGLVLYAITSNREIGIDLERVHPVADVEQIAEYFFSDKEKTAFRSLSTNLKYKAFFTCWTRKEAYIKARGEGLSMPLDQFDVSLVPGEPAILLSTRGNPQEALRWSLQDLIPDHDYIAALAVEGHDWRLKCWQWPNYHSDFANS